MFWLVVSLYKIILKRIGLLVIFITSLKPTDAKAYCPCLWTGSIITTKPKSNSSPSNAWACVTRGPNPQSDIIVNETAWFSWEGVADTRFD